MQADAGKFFPIGEQRAMNAQQSRFVISVLGALLAAQPAWTAPPEITLSSGQQTFKLADERGKYVALHFLLKTECPYCLRTVTDYSKKAPTVAGVVHVFVKPDSEEEVRAWSEKVKSSDVDFPIYRDPDARLADELKIPGGYSFHGQTVHYPALVLFGPDGNEVFRYVGKNNTDRLSFEQLAAKVAELSKDPAIAQFNLADGGLALKGNDPVAYLEKGVAAPGAPEIASQYRGVSYRFANAENRQKFAADPQRFLPAYGGWCATAMAEGRKVEVDPANYKVTGGRLFLFYKGWRGDALKDWNKDEKNLTARADEQWRKIAPSTGMEKK